MSSLFVLGGARSGKSRYAQRRAEATGLRPVMIATAQALDDEMKNRIGRHRADRGAQWSTIEEPLALAAALRSHGAADRALLIDCLTLWATNLLLRDHDIAAAITQLTDAIAQAAGPVILVSNEVGLGIVPDNALSRRFRDAAGEINQAVAACVDEVQFLAAGLTMKLK